MGYEYIGPNLRGQAKRDKRKEVRVGTHEFVVRLIMDQLFPNVVIEHGMGIASTPLFHGYTSLKRLISLEDDQQWASCKSCPSMLQHDIMSYDKLTDDMMNDAVFLFLDGPDAQRRDLLPRAINASISVIVEHDAESFDSERVEFVRSCCSAGGYVAMQYICENPETVIYVRDDVSLNLDAEKFKTF